MDKNGLRKVVYAIILMSFVQGSILGFTRNEAINYFDTLTPTWDGVTTQVWINNNEADPGLNVGDKIIYTMSADEPAHYMLINIDSKGSTSVIKPTALDESFSPADSYIFPPLPDGCEFPISKECIRDTNAVIQGEPLGRETVFVIASNKEFPNEVLGIRAREDFRSLKSNGTEIQKLTANILEYADDTDTLITVGRYHYSVDGDVQIGTRAIGEMLISRSIGDETKSVVYDGELISQEIIDRNKGRRKEPAPVEIDGSKSPRENNSENKSDVIITSKNSVSGAAEQAPLSSSSAHNRVDIPQGDLIAKSRPAVKVLGKPIVANDISFEFASATLDKRGRRQLDVIGSELLERVRAQEFPVIALIGHTDSDGSEERNMTLSMERALSAKYYLVQDWGLPAKRILTGGKGELEPIVNNDSPSNRARNRRVEILLLR